MKKKKIIKKIISAYKPPFKIIVTPSFLKIFNAQKHNLTFFNSILIKHPKLYISECAYKIYKGMNKLENGEEIRKMSSSEKKKWKRTRFLNDLVRFCTIRKCDCGTVNYHQNVECDSDTNGNSVVNCEKNTNCDHDKNNINENKTEGDAVTEHVLNTEEIKNVDLELSYSQTFNKNDIKIKDNEEKGNNNKQAIDNWLILSEKNIMECNIKMARKNKYFIANNNSSENIMGIPLIYIKNGELRMDLN